MSYLQQPDQYQPGATHQIDPTHPPYPYAPQHVTPPKPKAPAWHKVLGITTLSLIGLCVIGTVASIASSDDGGGGGGGGAPVSQTTALEDARANCSPGDPDISLGDEGRSMTITGAGHYSGAEIEDVACILGELNIPDSVVARIDSTRALDGMQEATWDGYLAVWTYHPDDGLNLIIEEAA